MKSDWKIKKLSDVANINPIERLSKGSIAKKIGMDKLQPFCRNIPSFEYEAYSGGAKFRNGDTIMARITPCLENGKTAKVSILENNEIGFGSTEYIVFRPTEESDEDYLYYLVRSPLVREPAIKSMVGSSGRQRVQTSVVENLEICIPPLSEQKRIGSLLKALDDKIELNTQMIDNLTEQDIALMKSIAESSSSKLPLRSVCNQIYAGGTPNRKQAEYWNKPSIIWFKNGEVKNNILIDSEEKISESAIAGSSAKLVPSHSILFAMYCVSTPQVAINALECTTNQAVCSLIIQDFDMLCYVYYYLMHYGFELTNLANGAAQQNLNKGMIEAFTIKFPDKQEEKLSVISNHVRLKISLTKENQVLSHCRDALLPKLMTGELEIP